MSRVNVFAKVSNDNGRNLSIGGRGRQDRVSVWLNTDTAEGQRDMSVSAEVIGNTDSKSRRKEGDNRVAVFSVELPERGGTRVEIAANGESFRWLARVGAMLVGMKGAIEGKPALLKFSGDTMKELEAEASANLPDVTLPGGVSLARALACVRMIEAMERGDGN